MGGAKYVSQLIEQFKGYSNGLELAIAGYNAGPGAVMKYGYQIPPYAETQAYVKKVLGYVKFSNIKHPLLQVLQRMLKNRMQILKNYKHPMNF